MRQVRGSFALAVIVAAILMLAGTACAAPRAATKCDVTQYFKKSVCSGLSCQAQWVPTRGGGRIIGRGEDGCVYALTHARDRAKGTAYVDAGDGTEIQARVVALDKRLDVALVCFSHPAPLEAWKDVPSPFRQFVLATLGKMPVADGPRAGAPSTDPRIADPPPPVDEPAPAPPRVKPNAPEKVAENQSPTAKTGYTEDEIRGFLRDEADQVVGKHAGQLEQRITAAIAAGKADTQKFLKAHGGEIAQKIEKGNAANQQGLEGLPDVIVKAFKSFAPELVQQLVADLVPLMPKAASIAGIVASVGVPGAAGVALLGWLFSRALGKNTTVLRAIASHLGRQAGGSNQPLNSHDNPNLSPPSPPAPPAGSTSQEPPADKLVLDTTTTVTRDESWRTAYSRAKQAFARKDPNSLGSIALFESLFNQFLSGVKNPPVSTD